VVKYPVLVSLDVVPDCKPGDPPPEGYMAWHHWAQVQYRAGLRQRTCPSCGLWQFPQEFSPQTIRSVLYDCAGREIVDEKQVCVKCAPKEAKC
jgi:hypothetical protein